MRSLPVKIVVGTLGVAFLAVLWVFFAPTKLGGSTTYSVTSGISMEPLLHKNDLAFVRQQPQYHVGEVVLYQSPVLHRPVLHRIILIQHGNYFFKGDNNDFVDPGYATKSELLGTLWFKVPAVGAVLSWFGTPFHAALLAAVAGTIIVFAGITTTKRRRRRRRGGASTISYRAPTPSVDAPTQATAGRVTTNSEQVSKRRPPPYLEGPASTLVATGIALSLAVLLVGIGFSRPTTRVGEAPNAYEQAGTFAYSATTNAPNAVYPSGSVNTGDPIYPSLVDTVNLRFGYTFTSKLAHHVSGTIELRMLVLSKSDTWQEVSTVVPISKFSGDNASASSDLSLPSLYTLIDSVSTQSGVIGTNYSLDVQPVVHMTGTVDGKPIDQKYSPVLPFAVTQSAIRLDVAVAPPPPGATYVPSSATAALDAALHPLQLGSVPRVVTNDISVARYNLPVPVVRFAGIAFAVLGILLAGLHDRRRRKGTKRSEEDEIARRLHVLIVPIGSLGSTEGTETITVPDFANLAGLARFLERPILYAVRGGQRVYLVDDDARRYITAAVDRRRSGPRNDAQQSDEPAAPPPAPPPAPHPAPADVPSTPTPTRRQLAGVSRAEALSKGKLAVRCGAVLLLVAVVATLTISFTASTTVPASFAGRSTQTTTTAQLSPASCTSLSPTTLLTRSGTFSNSASHVLILGSSGVDTITDTGHFNCIIGGGGKDKVTGTSDDFCIIGPTSGATYTTCVKKTQ